MRQRLHDGVAGAQLRRLPGPGQIGGGQCLANLLATMAVNDADAAGGQLARGVEDMAEQGLAGKRMQHFGVVRMHPLALTGGEYDDVHRNP